MRDSRKSESPRRPDCETLANLSFRGVQNARPSQNPAFQTPEMRESRKIQLPRSLPRIAPRPLPGPPFSPRPGRSLLGCFQRRLSPECATVDPPSAAAAVRREGWPGGTEGRQVAGQRNRLACRGRVATQTPCSQGARRAHTLNAMGIDTPPPLQPP